MLFAIITMMQLKDVVMQLSNSQREFIQLLTYFIFYLSGSVISSDEIIYKIKMYKKMQKLILNNSF